MKAAGVSAPRGLRWIGQWVHQRLSDGRRECCGQHYWPNLATSSRGAATKVSAPAAVSSSRLP
jgi:hypothetical protein